MALLGYNRKLLWVVLPAMLWAWLGLATALAPPPGQRPPGGDPPVRMGIGPAVGGVYLPGMVKRVVETPGLLTITIEVAPDAPRDVFGSDMLSASHMPPGLKVEYVSPGELAPGPPELKLMGEMRQGKRLPGGASGILTENYLLKLDKRGVRIMPRPFELAPPRGGSKGPLQPGLGRELPRDKFRERAREWLKNRQRPEKQPERKPPPGNGRNQPGRDHNKEDDRAKPPRPPGGPGQPPNGGGNGGPHPGGGNGDPPPGGGGGPHPGGGGGNPPPGGGGGPHPGGGGGNPPTGGGGPHPGGGGGNPPPGGGSGGGGRPGR